MSLSAPNPAVKLALSALCENPCRRTGLSTLFHEFVAHALREHPQVRWVVFVGPEQEWRIADDRVELVRDFPANDRRGARLWADHFQVARAARRSGAQALLTVGFFPLDSAGLPVVMHIFSVHHRRPGGGWRALYRRLMVGWGLRRAALVIANSRWTADQLGPVRAPMIVSYEGVQHDQFLPEGPRGMAELPANYLLWVGNFYPYKRVELALMAYARLDAELRARFPFVLVGGDWEGGGARARTVARELGIESDLRFLGWVADAALPRVYRGAQAYVLSTAEETFGRSVAEAMACGCPCVLQDLPVLREVTGGAAVYVDFTDTGLAGEALRRVCTDGELVARLRERGLRRAADFDFATLARERVAAILDRLPRR